MTEERGGIGEHGNLRRKATRNKKADGWVAVQIPAITYETDEFKKKGEEEGFSVQIRM